MMDEFIDRHSPKKREERREKRRYTGARVTQKRSGTGGAKGAPTTSERSRAQAGLAIPHESTLVKASSCGLPTQAAEASVQDIPHSASLREIGDRTRADKRRQDPRPRYIPAKTRDAVFKRDNGKCTYVGKTGRRCGSTHNLQIDHIVPFARGGKNTLSNLRLLCGKHNRLEAKRILGANTMNQFVRRE